MSTPPVHEHALSFACEGEQLVGVLSTPAEAASDLALLVVVGGPQVRTGSHRQFTRLCRAVAAAGVPAMRFDVRGMGDSSGALHTFEHIEDDIAAALAALQARLPDVTRVVLWGLCDGASASLMYLQARRDPRVAGLVLLNPWVRSAQTLAKAHVKHYYAYRLRQPEFWRKLLGGGVALRAVRDLVANVRTAKGIAPEPQAGDTPLPFQERMLRGAEWFAGPVLWVLSGKDHTAREFNELVAGSARWQALLQRTGIRRQVIPSADHTFSDQADERALEELTTRWIQSVSSGPQGPLSS